MRCKLEINEIFDDEKLLEYLKKLDIKCAKDLKNETLSIFFRFNKYNFSQSISIQKNSGLAKKKYSTFECPPYCNGSFLYEIDGEKLYDNKNYKNSKSDISDIIEMSKILNFEILNKPIGKTQDNSAKLRKIKYEIESFFRLNAFFGEDLLKEIINNNMYIGIIRFFKGKNIQQEYSDNFLDLKYNAFIFATKNSNYTDFINKEEVKSDIISIYSQYLLLDYKFDSIYFDILKIITSFKYYNKYTLILNIEKYLNIKFSEYSSKIFKDINWFQNTFFCEQKESKKEFKLFLYRNYENFDFIIRKLKYLEGDYCKKITLSLLDCIGISGDAFDNRNYIILVKRKAHTLREISNLFGITRERVRQIEEKYTKKLTQYLSSIKGKEFMFSYILPMFRKIYYIKLANFEKIFGDFGYVLFNVLKDLDFAEIHYNKQYGTLNIGNYDWISDLEYHIEQFEDVLSFSETKEKIEFVIAYFQYKGIGFNYNEILDLFNYNYLKEGLYLSRKKMSLTEKYTLIVKNHYFDGINVYSEREMKIFRNLYFESFLEKDILNRSTRAIRARIEDSLECIDKGVFNIEERVPRISVGLIDKINNFIIEIEDNITWKNLYTKFKIQLLKENITSQFMLREILRRDKSRTYFVDRYILSKSGNINYLINAKTYCNEIDGVIDISEVSKLFPPLEKQALQFALYHDKNYIILFGNKALRKNKIKVQNDEFERILYLVTKLVNEGTIIRASKLFDALTIKFDKFLERNFILNAHDVYNIISVMYVDEFSYRRPFMSEKQIIILSPTERINNYVYSKNTVEINEFKDFLNENDLRINSLFRFIVSLLKDYAWYDLKTLIQWNKIHFSKSDLDNIRLILINLLCISDYLELSKLNMRGYFPELNVKWTKYLLFSIINNEIPELRIIYSTKQYLNTNFYLVKKNSKIRNIDDIYSLGGIYL